MYGVPTGSGRHRHHWAGRGEWIKPGAIVIDVGINRQTDGRLLGDVEFDLPDALHGSLRSRAAWAR